ncbi:MAG: hypothetical protein ACLPYS_20025 [Vulcanimicrobiaceae bacterium]
MRRAEVDAKRFGEFLSEFVALEGAGGKISLAKLDNERARRTDKKGVARTQLGRHLTGEQAPLPPRAFYIGEALRGLGVSWCSGFVALGAAGYVGERIALQEAMDQQDALKGAFLWAAAFAEPHLNDESDLNRKAAEVTLSVSWDAIGDEAMKRAWETAGIASFRPKGLAADLLAIYSRADYGDESEREEVFSAVYEVWRKRHPIVPYVAERVGKHFPWEENLRAILAQQSVPADVAFTAPESRSAGRRTREKSSTRPKLRVVG